MIRAWVLLALAAAGLISAVSARSPAPVNHAAIAQGMAKNLSDYGFFDDLAQQEGAFLQGYRLNTPLYSDGADKLRFVFLPEGQRLSAGADGLLQFPVGSALIKTFAFGEGEERRLIETRVLLHRADGWAALPYLWNEEQSDARLVLAGARVPIKIRNAAQELEEISYRVPNKNQCKQCHVKDGSVTPIGPKLNNLSAVLLERWTEMGMLEENLLPLHSAAPGPAMASMPLWDDPKDGTAEARARAYLDVNCAHCHRPGASASNSGLDLRWEQQDPFAYGVGKPPVAAGRGSGGHLVSIAPGAPERSIIVHRMASDDPGVAMPELSKATVDARGVAAVSDWIAAMPAEGAGK